MKVSGREVADAIAKKLQIEVKELKVVPTLAIILAGNDPSSRMYVDFKIKKAKELGIKIGVFEFLQNQFQEVLETIKRLNADKNINGIIVQYPLYKDWNSDLIFETVISSKDVDGFKKDSPFKGATALGIWEMLTAFSKLEKFPSLKDFLKGKNIVLLGKGRTAGGPFRDLLTEKNIPFTLIDSKTENSEELIKNADVIISATGKKHIITGDKIKAGSYVIGVGVGKEDGKTYGDIEENSVGQKAKLYCPTIGGIGPLTIVCLLRNVLESAKKAQE